MSNPQVVNLPPTAPAAVDVSGRPSARHAAPVSMSAFVPMLICALTLLVWFVFQGALLVNDRQALQATYLAQQQTVDNAGKLRASLDALAADTQRMADAGNPNAALLVTELRKRGITITVPAAAAPATPAAPAPAR